MVLIIKINIKVKLLKLFKQITQYKFFPDIILSTALDDLAMRCDLGDEVIAMMRNKTAPENPLPKRPRTDESSSGLRTQTAKMLSHTKDFQQQ